MTEEEYKTLYTIIHSLIFDSITEYQKNEFYLNRENFFIKNTESSEISFLQNELSELKRTFSNFKNQRSLILNDFEKVFPEKDFDKEFDRWSEMEVNLIENIDFVKNKLILENDLQKVKRIKVKESPQIEFKDFFQDESGYGKTIKRFAEKGYINPETLVWIDHGDGYKSTASGLLKYLHSIGYLKVKMTNNQILNILKNTFKIDVGIDTIKKAKSDNPIFEKLKL